MSRTLSFLLVLLSFIALIPLSQAQAASVHNSTVIVLDASGSMDEFMRDERTGRNVQKMAAAKDALKGVLRQVPADTHVGLLVFSNGRNAWAYELSPLDIPRMELAIDRIRHDGGTPLGAAIKIGADALLADRGAQHGVGRYQLLVVTDGQASDEGVMRRYAPMVPERGIRLDVIGVAMPGGEDHDLARFAHSYQAVDNAVKLQTTLAQLVRVEAGGDNAPVDFSVTDGVPLDVARVWVSALSAPAPNHALGETPSDQGSPAKQDVNGSSSTNQTPTGCNTALEPIGWWVYLAGMAIGIVLFLRR